MEMIGRIDAMRFYILRMRLDIPQKALILSPVITYKMENFAVLMLSIKKRFGGDWFSDFKA